MQRTVPYASAGVIISYYGALAPPIAGSGDLLLENSSAGDILLEDGSNILLEGS